MTKEEFRDILVGDLVTYELNRITYKVIDLDENGFVTEDNVYHSGSTLSDFCVGAGWLGAAPIYYSEPTKQP